MKNELVQGMFRVDEMQNLRFQSTVNLVLGLCATAFSAICLVLIILNRLVKECNEDEGCVKPTSELNFHLLEFWSYFLFNVTNVFVLAFSNRIGGPSKKHFPLVFKVMVFINISASLICATMISINLEVFEVAAHELDYANELTMAFIDSIFLLTFLRSQSSMLARSVAALAGAVGLSTAIIQLSIYNGLGWEDGSPNGEVAAHYFEFSLGMLVGLVTASFAFDNKFRCDSRLEELLALSGVDVEVVECASP